MSDALTAAESLEVRIERVWDYLTDMPIDWTRTVQMNRRGQLVVTFEVVTFRHYVVVGRYNREIELADFRADVFCAFEQIRGRG